MRKITWGSRILLNIEKSERHHGSAEIQMVIWESSGTGE
jgi:hypothetical protein